MADGGSPDSGRKWAGCTGKVMGASQQRLKRRRKAERPLILLKNSLQISMIE
jgi:hypothetical protein